MGSIGNLFGGGGSSGGAPGVSSGVTSGLGNLSGQEAALSPFVFNLAGQESALSPFVSNLAGTQGNYGQEVLPTALSQYQAGATGQLTPSQQATVQEQLGQANLNTAGAYGNMGIGGSTMQTQDMNANRVSNLAEQWNLAQQSENLGLQGLQQGNALLSAAEGGYNTAGGLLSGAGSLLGTEGGLLSGAGGLLGTEGQLQNQQAQIQNQQTQNLINALGSAGNKGAGGGAGSSSGGGAGSSSGGGIGSFLQSAGSDVMKAVPFISSLFG